MLEATEPGITGIKESLVQDSAISPKVLIINNTFLHTHAHWNFEPEGLDTFGMLNEFFFNIEKLALCKSIAKHKLLG